MCGIFGYFDRRGRELSDQILMAMASSIRHRGPDKQAIFTEPGMALGNQRLSIIDVGGGSQPFVSDDGNIVVVQNGEIFNHVELAAELRGTRFTCRTHSDTEVLLRLYERDGINFVPRLNGMFAIAIFDRRTQSIYLIRDRVGVKPLYIFDDGGRAVFGSEIKAILPATGSLSMNEEALHHLLTYNYVPCPFTMFTGVRHILPGHWLKIDRTGSQQRRWWDLASVEPVEQSETAWIEEVSATLEDSVRIRLRADVPFGAFLSGGVDSSTVVGLMSRHMASPVKTFSIGFDDPRYDETAFAQEAADMFGTEHTSQRVASNMLDLWPLTTYHCDQPHGDVSFLPTYKLAEMAAKRVKMVLTGDGGDELFAGYDKHKDFFTPAVEGLDEAAFRKAYYRNICLFQDEEKQRLLMNVGTQMTNTFALVSDLFDRVPHWDRINQALYIDMELLLSGNSLVKPDRMGMAVSLEARTPFLDYRMIELAFRMPGKMKLRDGVTKYILKKTVAPMIGQNLAYRKKQMFTVPVGSWFRNELREYCRHMLGDQSFGRRTGLFSDEVSVLVENHIRGSHNNTREIRALIAIEHWATAFSA